MNKKRKIDIQISGSQSRNTWVCNDLQIFSAVTMARAQTRFAQTEVIVILCPPTSVHRSLLSRNAYTLSGRRMHVTSPLLRIVGAGGGSTESLSRERNCRSGSERGTFTRRSSVMTKTHEFHCRTRPQQWTRKISVRYCK